MVDFRSILVACMLSGPALASAVQNMPAMTACQEQGAVLRSIQGALEAAIKRYASCTMASFGNDPCDDEFASVQSLQVDFDRVARFKRTVCGQ